MNCQETRSLLDAYADGELDAAGDLQIESHVRGCADCAKALEESRTLSEALRSNALRYSAPAGMREIILGSLASADASGNANASLPILTRVPSPFSRHWWPLAAAAAIFLLGALAGGFGFQRHSRAGDVNDSLAQEVVSSHVRSLLADSHLADVLSSDRHTVKPWFEGKVDFSPPVSDLAAKGFPLVGGRLDYLDGRPVASLIYRRDKHVINVFVWPLNSREGDSDGKRENTRQGYHLFRWEGAGMNWWAVSDLNETELAQFSGLLRTATSN